MNNIDETAQTNQNSRHKFSVIKIVLYIFIGIILVMAFLRSLNPDNNIIGIDNMRKAYSIATEIVTEQFLEGTEIDFPKFDKNFVKSRSEELTYEGEDYYVYTVSSYFKFENIFGTDTRDEYVIKVGLPTNKKNDNYYYEIISDSLELFEWNKKTACLSRFFVLIPIPPLPEACLLYHTQLSKSL